MDMAAISQLISTVGFPIACCIYLAKTNSNLQTVLKDLEVTLSTMNERIKEIEDKIEKE